MYGEQLPDLAPYETMHEAWQQAGYSASGINGPEPFSWVEIQAFSEVSERNMTKMEMRVLMDMSRAFCRGFADKNPMSIQPMERKHV